VPSGDDDRRNVTRTLILESMSMRAEIEAIVDEIKQGMALLRRHL
jgi:hypothetical protein